jgi:hypothetical protein
MSDNLATSVSVALTSMDTLGSQGKATVWRRGNVFHVKVENETRCVLEFTGNWCVILDKLARASAVAAGLNASRLGS